VENEMKEKESKKEKELAVALFGGTSATANWPHTLKKS
jgi:hypothetical protein